MTDTPTPETDEPTAEDALKRRLLNRIAIAAVMVVGLLGSLAMFDALNNPKRPPTQVAALPPKPEPPPVLEAPKEEPKPAEAAPGTAPTAEAKPEAGAESKATATAESPAEAKPVPTVPERTASPGAPPLQPLPAEKPLTKPATTKPAAVRPSEPVPPAASPAARPDPARELAQAPATPRRAPASRPITQAAERQFAIQMGVFNNVANAEDLRAKLELNGIPSTIEARVHVGPFASRAEADAARAKLKELGMESGLLVTMKK